MHAKDHAMYTIRVLIMQFALIPTMDLTVVALKASKEMVTSAVHQVLPLN